MRVLLRVSVQFMGILITLLLFVACASGTREDAANVSALPYSTSTDVLLLPLQTPFPPHILDAAPLPGSSLSLWEYQKGRHAERGQFLILESASQICLEIDAVWFLERGDHFVIEDQVSERIQFTVDGRSIQQPNKIVDLAMEFILADEEGNEIGVAGGPFVLCWHSDLGVGLHTARIDVRKTSGEVLKYEWSFRLTDLDDYPTSTPVPTGFVVTVEAVTVVPRTASPAIQ